MLTKTRFLVILSLFASAAATFADCPVWAGRPETYALGSVLNYNGSNYKVVRNLDNGWIHPTDTWFWAPTAETCDAPSSSSTCDVSSSSSSDNSGDALAAVLARIESLEARVIALEYWRDNMGLVDPRDGQFYQIAKIGNQTWMASNLNFSTMGASCYQNSEAYCKSYGRLYTHATALQVCPEGWHLPTTEEWTELIQATGNPAGAGRLLKSAAGWNNNGNGIDQFGFKVLPSGLQVGSYFHDAGFSAFIWTATDYNGASVYAQRLFYGNDYIHTTPVTATNKLSVRCIKDQ